MSRNSSANFIRNCGRVLFTVVVAGLTFTLPAQSNDLKKMPPPAPRRPSIILIVADNLGVGDLGSYGQALIKTPSLDQLAAEGIRFTSFYAGSPEDATARVALLTGREPRYLNADFNQTLPADAVTVATLLQRQGYHTGLIGTWGLGDTGTATPDKNGFDEFAGFLSVNHARDYFTDRIWRHDPMQGDTQMVFPENEHGKRGKFMPDVLTTAAVNFVQNNKPELLNHYRPFFLCLAYPIPQVSVNATPPGTSPYADASWPPLERTRATLISRMDDGIGQLLNKLVQLKLNTNTIVIFTSAGGPQNEKGVSSDVFNSTGVWRGRQGSLNEGGLRVPLIVRWPLGIKPAQTSDFTCAAWDVVPTLTQLALIPPSEKSDGLSLLPTLMGRAQTNRHDSFYWESQAEGFKQAVRSGDWKAIRSATNQPLELYNLKTDPAEKANVATNNPAIAAKLEKLLNSDSK